MRHLFCFLFGHKWETDECGKPNLSHDYTLYCVRCCRMYDVGGGY